MLAITVAFVAGLARKYQWYIYQRYISR